MRNRLIRRRAGYSLLEILIVISIIALISALVGPRLFAQFDKSKTVAARLQEKSLKAALETMRLDIGRFPTEQEGLNLLAKQSGEVPNWSGPYLSGGLPKDPWSRDYMYVPPAGDGQDPKIASYGSDGKSGGSGSAADIVE